MKKQVLIGSVLLAAISAFSQTGMLKPTGIVNSKTIADAKFMAESTPMIKPGPVKPTASEAAMHMGSKAAAGTWKSISASMNIYGVIISYAKPLQWNDELNAVSFVHRKSPTYLINPAPAANAANGNMVAFISTDCGANWDSTAIYTNNTFWGRYPNGAIYNPPGNTDISNAYIVGAGPTTGNGSSTSWIGNWYASKKLGAANYNSTPGAGNSQQVIPTAGPYGSIPSRHDFSAYNLTATDDGKMRILAGITDDAATSDTAVMLVIGDFNSSTGTFDWSGKVFDPPTTVNGNDGSENWTSRPMMAWSEDGTIGYVIIMGARLGATGSNAGFQPIVYKTVNKGGTWSLENSIDFSAPQFKDVKDKIWPVYEGGDTVPNFFWMEGIDCTVDANGKLHIFTSITGHSSNHPDSLNFISQWSTEKYLWPHTNISDGGEAIHASLWDFMYDGTSETPSWSHFLVDEMSSEGPSGLSNWGGYQDNPWDMDPGNANQKVRVDARLQLSRTPDGKQIVYTWSESDTAFTDQQKKWNILPNLKARMYDVEYGKLSPTKIDITTNDAPSDVASHAMYQCVSPKMKVDSKTPLLLNVSIPITVSNSSPYAQLTANTHWYTCSTLAFDRPLDVGIKENKANTALNSSIYPNPAKNAVTVNVSLTNTSKVQVEVLNTIGQVVKTVSSQGQTGNNTIHVDLNGLSSGIYLVNIKTNTAGSTKKLVIE